MAKINGYEERCSSREAAMKTLKRARALENSRDMYVWSKKGITISHPDLDKLKNIISTLGYEWNQGNVTRKAKKCD